MNSERIENDGIDKEGKRVGIERDDGPPRIPPIPFLEMRVSRDRSPGVLRRTPNNGFPAEEIATAKEDEGARRPKQIDVILSRTTHAWKQHSLNGVPVRRVEEDNPQNGLI